MPLAEKPVGKCPYWGHFPEYVQHRAERRSLPGIGRPARQHESLQRAA